MHEATTTSQRQLRDKTGWWRQLSLECQAVHTLWTRDMLHFLRERSRIVGSLAQPLFFWALIGTGIGSTFQPKAFPEGFSYLGFFYPGAIGLTLLFTSIFSTISVIADREYGFLKEILVSPTSRASIVLGKVAAGATLATAQGVILLLLAPALGLALTVGGALRLILVMAVTSAGLTALGLAVAWNMNSTQGFHMVMNFLLFPMWLLSGAAFPVEGVPTAMRIVMLANPLTYGIDALRGVLATPGSLPPGFVQFPFVFNALLSAAFTAGFLLLALRVCRTTR